MKVYIHSNLMKMKQFFIFYILLILFMASCSTPKGISYFQDAEAIHGMAVQPEQQFRLRPEDKINIIVNSSDPMLESQFTLTANNRSQILGSDYNPVTAAGKSANNNSIIIAYTVDEQGDITFPVLGKISVLGKNRTEVADFISKRLVERDLVKDPIVTVEYVNIGVSILGEVKNPGRINVTRDHLTILEAIAYAGDLTINGVRENVIISRQIDGEHQTYIIDLTSKQDILLSPAYYLQQNDIVYITPNDKRKREATGIGNTMLAPSFWISVASLLTTITA